MDVLQSVLIHLERESTALGFSRFANLVKSSWRVRCEWRCDETRTLEPAATCVTGRRSKTNEQ